MHGINISHPFTARVPHNRAYVATRSTNDIICILIVVDKQKVMVRLLYMDVIFFFKNL